MYEVERITIEVISAIACFILVRFMIKPFRLTGETRYLGLPLGFGMLGAAYTFSALSFSNVLNFESTKWIQLFVRAFAFIFLAVTYYFSKSTKKPKLLWNATISVLTVGLTISIALAIAFPQFLATDYQIARFYVPLLNLACISYISIHALRSHMEQPDPTTLMIPLGYIILGIGQYSLLISAYEENFVAFFGALALRLAGLAVFLFVSYETFRGSKKGK